MAWRPTQHLLEGELDNTIPGKVTGWMRFAGMNDNVTFDLKGDFHRDIRGAKIHLVGDGRLDHPDAVGYMEGFALRQHGTAGHMTAGLPPREWTDYPYFEWHGDKNDRVVLTPEPHQVRVERPEGQGREAVLGRPQLHPVRARMPVQKVPVTAALAQPSSTNG